ncbi:MAG: nitroreductase family protein [Bacteroidales bacterium]
MNILEMMRKCRSYRRFDATYDIYKNELIQLVNIARLAPSARNMQPLRYRLVYTRQECNQVFPHLAWAGYLKDWEGPAEDERPTAYMIVTRDSSLSDRIFCDDGLAIQAMLLGAVEMGLGGCIIGAFKKNEIREALKIDEKYEILYVIALGKPTEEIILENICDDDIKYWRSADGVHHVPKRSIEDLIL